MNNYPQMKKGIGLISPAMWSRMMKALEHYENKEQDRSDELSPESLSSRITDLEMHKPYFFAKLLRAHVLNDLSTPNALTNANVYEYAWVEVKSVTHAVDCCRSCLNSRHCPLPDSNVICEWSSLLCCGQPTNPYCTSYLAYQGHWNWWEDTLNTSWGDTLPEDGFVNYEPKSHFDPEGYPYILGSPLALNEVAYTKPAMNILEAFNTSINAGGVDQSKGVGDFMLQAIGGGDTQYDGEDIGEFDTSIPQCWDEDIGEPPCTQFEFPLKTTPIVLMHNIRETDGTLRQVFQAANSYDGTCVSC